jgi:hypothetical protein
VLSALAGVSGCRLYIPMAKKRRPGSREMDVSPAAAGGPLAVPNPETADAHTEVEMPQPRAWDTALVALVVALCAAFIVIHTQVVDKRLTLISQQWILEEHAKTGPPTSRILPDFAFDGYKWIPYARHMAATGEWRLRWTDTDNAPEGRPVHWNSGLAWLLVGLGWVHHSATGATMDASIERMAVWAGSVSLIFFISLIAWLTARRMGPLAGVLIAAGMLGSASFHEGFLPAYPDHHGLISASALGTVLGLIFMGFGWVAASGKAPPATPPTLRHAMGGAWISAAFIALGFWVSAFSQAILIAFVALAAILSALIFGPGEMRSKRVLFEPRLWRLWGRASGGLTLALYLVEFFPSWPRLQLEVNHPLYALTLLALGEWMALVLPCLATRRLPERPHVMIRNVAIWSVLGVLPGIALLVFGSKVHAALDPFLFNLHKHIFEFQSVTSQLRFGLNPWPALIPFAVIVGLGLLFLLFHPELSPATRGVLFSTMVVCVLLLGMRFYQARWGLNAGSVLLALIPVLWCCLIVLPGIRNPRWLPYAILVAATLALGYAYPKQRLSGMLRILKGGPQALTQEEARHLLLREVAEWIKRRSPGRELTFLSSPNSSLMSTYFGRAKGIGTLYWENNPGLKTAAHMLGSLSDEESFKLIKEHGVTHIIFITWENFIVQYHQLIHPGCPNTEAHLKQIAGVRWFFGRQIPIWTRPMPWPRTPLQQKLEQDVLLLEVVPDQKPHEAYYYLGTYLAHEGKPEEARKALQEAVRLSPSFLAPRPPLAALYFRSGMGSEGLRALEEGFKAAPAEQRRGYFASAASLARMARPQKLAVGFLQRAMEAAPDFPESPMHLAWILATSGDADVRRPEEAKAALATAARGATPEDQNSPAYLEVHAAVLAANGDPAGAAALIDRARQAVLAQNANADVSRLAAQLAEYQAGRAWTEH